MLIKLPSRVLLSFLGICLLACATTVGYAQTTEKISFKFYFGADSDAKGHQKLTPDDLNTFNLPHSPKRTVIKPAGN